MNTRRYPRTLQEAFGPYTDNQIHEPHKPLTLAQIILYPAAVVGVAWLLLLIF